MTVSPLPLFEAVARLDGMCLSSPLLVLEEIASPRTWGIRSDASANLSQITRPEALMHGMLTLKEKVMAAKRRGGGK